jgi:FAD/FMN-containing dehydrogenase
MRRRTFNHRASPYDLVIMPMWTDAAESEKHIRWADELWKTMQPFSSGGVYVNYLGDEGEDRVKAGYGTNYQRLVALKNKYDPTNLFRFNQNIVPTRKNSSSGTA